MGRWAQRHRRGGDASSTGGPPPPSEFLVYSGQPGTFYPAQQDSTNQWGVFKFTPSTNGLVVRMQLRIFCTNGAGWYVYPVLYSDSAGSPGTLLGTGAGVISSGITVSGLTLTEFPGFPSVPVTTGNNYWIGVNVVGAGASQSVGESMDDHTNGGYKYSTDGSTWLTGYSIKGPEFYVWAT